MLQNFAHFVGQFGIQNLIISDSFKFSAPLLGSFYTGILGHTIFFILGSHYSGIMGLNYITKVGSHYTGILGSFYTGKRRSLFTGILFTLYWERDHTILIYKVYSILV